MTLFGDEPHLLTIRRFLDRDADAVRCHTNRSSLVAIRREPLTVYCVTSLYDFASMHAR
jgi:hypothetical protein